jgi:hypothetical protein
VAGSGRVFDCAAIYAYKSAASGAAIPEREEEEESVMRKYSLCVSVLAVVLMAPPAWATCTQSEQVTASDGNPLLCIDADDNGAIDTGEDCCITGTVESCPEDDATTSTLMKASASCYEARQGTMQGTAQIRGCDANYPGSSTPTSIEVTGTFQGSNPVPIPPIFKILGENGEAPGRTMGEPSIPEITMYEILSGTSKVGSARACSIGGGPGVEIVDHGGTAYAVRLEKIEGDPDYLCAKAPVPLADGGTELLSVCVPVDENYDWIFECDEDPVSKVPYGSTLPPCGAAQMAPSLGEKGLIALSVLLLIGGTWMLRRRTSFGDSLRST